MADYLEVDVAAATITASGTSSVLPGVAVSYSPPALSRGFTYGIFSQEIISVSSLTSWNEKLQYVIGTQATYDDLYLDLGGGAPSQVMWPQTAAAGLQQLVGAGAVPANLKLNYTLVGTNVKRAVHIALAG